MLFANSAIVFSKSSLAVDCSNSGGAEGETQRGERKAEEKASTEEEAMVTGERGAGSHPEQEAMARERIVQFPLGDQRKWATVLSHQICTLPCPGYWDKG